MIGALIGAGSSLIGGLLGKSSAEKQAKQNIKHQKEFAQNGIQWKVNDAKKAGIHPLYAMGAQTTSFSPVSVGDPLPGAIADMGQGIGRAVESGMSNTGRNARLLEGLSVKRAELENLKLASEIKVMNQAGQPPPPVVNGAVIPGQGNSVTNVPHEVTSTVQPGITAGAPAETTLYQTSRGFRPGMSEVYAEGAGEGVIGSSTWGLGNLVPPFFGDYHKGLPPPKEGHMWIWNPIGFEYVQTPKPNWHDIQRSKQ